MGKCSHQDTATVLSLLETTSTWLEDAQTQMGITKRILLLHNHFRDYNKSLLRKVQMHKQLLKFNLNLQVKSDLIWRTLGVKWAQGVRKTRKKVKMKVLAKISRICCKERKSILFLARITWEKMMILKMNKELLMEIKWIITTTAVGILMRVFQCECQQDRLTFQDRVFRLEIRKWILRWLCWKKWIG